MALEGVPSLRVLEWASSSPAGPAAQALLAKALRSLGGLQQLSLDLRSAPAVAQSKSWPGGKAGPLGGAAADGGEEAWLEAVAAELPLCRLRSARSVAPVVFDLWSDSTFVLA
jgi:hypothetical protein